MFIKIAATLLYTMLVIFYLVLFSILSFFSTLLKTYPRIFKDSL